MENPKSTTKDDKLDNSFFEEDYEEEEDDEVKSYHIFEGMIKSIDIEEDQKKEYIKTQQSIVNNISFSSDIDSIKNIKNKNFERQVTAQPVSYKNKLQ